MKSFDPAKSVCHGRKIILHTPDVTKSSPWFDLRIFYVRVKNFQIDNLTPEHLTVNHISLTPATVIEANGRRSSNYFGYVSTSLRRDRVDKRSEEATFVSTDSIRMSGSVRFEIYDRECLLLTGILERCSSNGLNGEAKRSNKKWNIKCHSATSESMRFLKSKQNMNAEKKQPAIEIYVAGCFSGAPIILTKTLQFRFLKKHQMKVMLDMIPEDDTAEMKNMESSTYQCSKQVADWGIDCGGTHARAEYLEEEDGELPWFNAGVKVGVGIGLGLCLGVGVLVRTYHATVKKFARRLL